MVKLRSTINVILAVALICAVGLFVGLGAAVAQEPPNQEPLGQEILGQDPPPPEEGEPANCTADRWAATLAKDKVAPVHQGETIKYTVTMGNSPGAPPSLGCNIEDANITFTQPAANGTASGTSAFLDTYKDFPADGSGNKTYSPNATYPILTYTIAVNLGVTSISARVDGIGTLMDGYNSTSTVSKEIGATVLWPDIAINKTADTPLSKAGDNITYTYFIENTGDCTLDRVSVIDTVLGTITSHFPTSLASGANATVQIDYTVLGTEPDPLVNVVNATYEDVTDWAVYDTDIESVDLVAPSLEITKTGDEVSKAGDNVTYSFFIENTGDCALNRQSVVDDLLGNITADFSATLAAGANETVEKVRLVLGTDPGPLVNNVTAIYTVTGLPNLITANSTHSVNLVEPGLEITKTGDTLSKVGDNVNYSFFIENTGDCVLNRQSVVDDLLGNITADFPATLAAGANATVPEVRMVMGGDPDPLVNNVTAIYQVDGLPNLISANSTHSVKLVAPDLEITKTGDTLSKVGDVVNYNFYILNTGDCTLNRQSVVDDLLGTITTDFPLTLGSGVGANISKQRTVQGGDADPLVNNVTAIYTVAGLPNLITANSTHSVDLVAPDLEITKTGDTLSKVGDNVNYSFFIENTGDCTLYRQSVVDDLLGNITADFPATLAVAENATVPKVRMVMGGDPDPLVNNVTATYTIAGLPNLITANSTHSVDLVAPDLEITKTGDDTSKAGDVVTYNFYILNTGDCTLNRQSVVDDLLGDITLDFPLTLGSGVGANITEQRTVLGTDPDPLVNNVTAIYTVTGLPNLITANSTHSVDLVHPSITCSKTAVPTSGIVGDTITYNISVTNTGDVLLNKTSIYDTLLLDKTADFPATLPIGATQSNEYTRAIQSGDPDPLLNTVTFHYSVPVLENDIPCTANASVDIEWGELWVCKYNDVDGTGHWDPGDPWLSGWHFTITGPLGYSYSGNTAGNGCIYLTHLVPGSYDATETLQTDWVNTDPGGLPPYMKTAIVPAGGSNRMDFGNWAPTACLEIFKYEDANVNGEWEPGEEGLAGWHFVVTGPNGFEWEGVTDANGLILIENILVGDYTATETLKAWWYNTTPLTQTATVVPGMECTRLDFGNREEFREIPPMVPAVDQWGIAAMIALFAGSLVWTVRRRRLAS